MAGELSRSNRVAPRIVAALRTNEEFQLAGFPAGARSEPACRDL